jgi:hypothetical protein
MFHASGVDATMHTAAIQKPQRSMRQRTLNSQAMVPSSRPLKATDLSRKAAM